MAMATALVVVRAVARDPALTLGVSAPKNSFTGERSSAMSMKNVEIAPDASLIQRSFGPR